LHGEEKYSGIFPHIFRPSRIVVLQTFYQIEYVIIQYKCEGAQVRIDKPPKCDGFEVDRNHDHIFHHHILFPFCMYSDFRRKLYRGYLWMNVKYEICNNESTLLQYISYIIYNIELNMKIRIIYRSQKK
jgi:hypothetical protein